MAHVSYYCSACLTSLLFVVVYSLKHHYKVLVGTGVGQIRYLNRALMRFDSKVSNV